MSIAYMAVNFDACPEMGVLTLIVPFVKEHLEKYLKAFTFEIEEFPCKRFYISQLGKKEMKIVCCNFINISEVVEKFPDVILYSHRHTADIDFPVPQ